MDANGTVTNGDLFSTMPGTLAGRYMRSFWQPVFRAKDLERERAYPTRIMGEDLTVYRGSSGKPYVVHGYCPHRAARMSVGWVEGEAIRCRYHGWQFGEGGKCIDRPGEDPAINSKISLRAYPAEEYLGLIFAYMGEGDPPPLRRFHDFERPGVLEVAPLEQWPCNYFNRIENATDAAHLPYTHRESVTRGGLTWRLVTPFVRSQETDYGIQSSEERPGTPTAILHFHMPNINQIRNRGRTEGTIEDASKLWGDRLFWRVPVDDNHCVSFVIDYFPLFGKDAEAYLERRKATEPVGLNEINATAESILGGHMRVEDMPSNLSTHKMFWIEDYCVQVGQQPISDEREEHLGRIDVGVVLMRKIWRRELQALAAGKPLKKWTSPIGLADANPG